MTGLGLVTASSRELLALYLALLLVLCVSAFRPIWSAFPPSRWRGAYERDPDSPSLWSDSGRRFGFHVLLGLIPLVGFLAYWSPLMRIVMIIVAVPFVVAVVVWLLFRYLYSSRP